MRARRLTKAQRRRIAKQAVTARDDRLHILARDVRRIAEDGVLPDGDGVTMPTRLWAEDWARGR